MLFLINHSRMMTEQVALGITPVLLRHGRQDYGFR